MENDKTELTTLPSVAVVNGAKSFLGKLLNPAIEEFGLTLLDKVRGWRFKRQVEILNKAEDVCKRNGINPKAINTKLLVPLLDGGSLEEDDALLDKWATLLANLSDPEQNIQNHVFPYILGQLSRNEFEALEEYFNEYEKVRRKLRDSIKLVATNKVRRTPEINKRLEELRNMLTLNLSKQHEFDLKLEQEKLQTEVDSFHHDRIKYEAELKAPIAIPHGELKNFELSNLTRLGLIKERVEYTANAKATERTGTLARVSPSKIDVEVDLDSDSKYLITELGEMFINSCQEKKKKT